MFRLNREIGILTFSMILLFGNLSIKAEDDKLEFVAENVVVHMYFSNNFTLSKEFISIDKLPEIGSTNPDLDNMKICKVYEYIVENRRDNDIEISLRDIYKDDKLIYGNCNDSLLSNQAIKIVFEFRDYNEIVEYDGASLRVVSNYKKIGLNELMTEIIDLPTRINNPKQISQTYISMALESLYKIKREWGSSFTRISYPKILYEENGKCQGVECSEYLKKKYGNSDWKVYEMGICHGGLCWIQLQAGSSNIFIVGKDILYPKKWDNLWSYVMFMQVEWIINEQKSVLTERRESLKKMNEAYVYLFRHLSIYKEEIDELISILYFYNSYYFVLDFYLEKMKNDNLVDDVLNRYERLKHDIEIGKVEIPVLISQYQAKQTIKIFVWAVFITLIIGILSILISICFSKSTFKDIKELKGIVEAMDEKTSNVVLILGDMQAKLKSTYSRKSKKSEKKKRKAK